MRCDGQSDGRRQQDESSDERKPGAGSAVDPSLSDSLEPAELLLRDESELTSLEAENLRDEGPGVDRGLGCQRRSLLRREAVAVQLAELSQKPFDPRTRPPPHLEIMQWRRPQLGGRSDTPTAMRQVQADK